MCVRCGTGRIAWCTDPYRHGESTEPVSPGDPPVVAGPGAGAAGVPCEIRRRVYSSVPGRAGNWSYSTVLSLPRVPVAGDWIMWDDGWASLAVEDVTLAPGRAIVEIRPVKTDSPDVLDELDRMGWEQHAGPWAGQRNDGGD